MKALNWIIKKDNICPATGTQCFDECCPDGAECNLKPAITGKGISWNAQNKYVSGWVASQGDMFADDWDIVE